MKYMLYLVYLIRMGMGIQYIMQNTHIYAHSTSEHTNARRNEKEQERETYLRKRKGPF